MAKQHPRDIWKANLMAADIARRGWVAKDLADAAGVAVSSVTRWLNGEHRTARMAKKMAFALGHPVDRYVKDVAA